MLRKSTPLRRRGFNKSRFSPTKPTKRKRRKRSPLTIAKEKLEEVQKELVIVLYGRDCFTCPQKNLTGMNCQLGHVPWPRSELSVRCIFDTRYTRIQCFRCNINCGGNGAKALSRMQMEGTDVDEMEAINKKTKGTATPIAWFDQKTAEYSERLESAEPCTCASFFTVRGKHKRDCPLDRRCVGCCCGGKYPSLKNHTKHSCWTETTLAV